MKSLRVVLLISVLAAGELPAAAMRMEIPAEPGRSCDDNRSPTILLSDVPKGTSSLKLRIRTLGGISEIPTVKVLPYAGNRLAPGAVRHFIGCDAGGKGSFVEIRIMARDTQGKVLASRSDSVYYPGW